MELKDKLLASFMAFEEKIKDNEDLHEVRNQAIKNFENKGFPTKKEEGFFGFPKERKYD
jgi:Fe-S cluster assembly protein SufD